MLGRSATLLLVVLLGGAAPLHAQQVIGWGDNSYSQLPPLRPVEDVVRAETGGGHVLALRSDGALVGWGANHFGQAVPPEGFLAEVVQVALGDAFSVALRADGTVVAWGDNIAGQTSVPPISRQ